MSNKPESEAHRTGRLDALNDKVDDLRFYGSQYLGLDYAAGVNEGKNQVEEEQARESARQRASS